MALSLRIATLDVFTSAPFSGNQLGLVHVPRGGLPQRLKQSIAREFNYSETVFLHEDGDSGNADGAGVEGGGRRLDIFTPYEELPFAGHPTIGALSYIALSRDRAASQAIRLQLKAGPVLGSFDAASRKATAVMPQDVRVHEAGMAEADVLESQPALKGAGPEGVGVATVSVVRGVTFVLTRLPDVESLGRVGVPGAGEAVGRTNLDAGWDRGFVGFMFYVVLEGGGGGVVKLRTRMVESEIGEDPATGAASCALAGYLALQEGGEGGESRYEMVQGVEMGRRSEIGLLVVLDGEGRRVERIELTGSAVIVMRGKMAM